MNISRRLNLKTVSGLLVMLSVFAYSCSDSWLEQPAKGALSDSQAASKKGAEESLIAAYSALKGNVGQWTGEHTNWVFGAIAGGDAHKGSDGGDQADINPIASFTANATNNFFNDKWVAVYDGVNRCNATLKIVALLSADAISDADRTRIIAEARFLRGWYHFEAKKMWNMVPYIDETIDYSKSNYNVPNDVDIWPKIEDDFEFAGDNLAESGMASGRANSWAAKAYLAKAYLYQKKYNDAKLLFTDIIANGVTPGGVPYGLNAKFHDNFESAFDNSKESIFAFQASINDGSGGNNANFNYILLWPYNNGPGGCCGFFQPSFDLANSYRTVGGLPILDGSYNVGANQLKNDQDIAGDAAYTPDAGEVDPRLDWTIGRRGLPYLDWGKHPGVAWVRLQSNGGPYSPKKHSYANEDASGVTDGSSWTKGLTSLNFVFMRFSDVLLMAAECEAEAGSLTTAQDYVNLIRARAANPLGFVKLSSSGSKTDWQAYKDSSVPSTDAANYVINQYAAGAFTGGGKAFALNAIHMERKLELAMEGHRFFDLVRWGETVAGTGNGVNLQAYFDYEGTKLGIYNGVTFVAGKHEYYPIPQTQRDLQQVAGSGSILDQNPGY